MLRTTPAVFAVGNNYQIMVPVTHNSLFWVEVGDKCFYDESNGIMRSLCTIHRVSVPMDIMDKAREYTVCERVIIDRKPYFAETEETVRRTFEFCSVPDGDIRTYIITDAHNKQDEPIAEAKKFGKIDVLIMLGDIINHSGDIAYFDTVYQLAQAITGGSVPVVFVRGNHDLRGYYAEQFAEYTPNHHGNTYYTFRLGSLWGMILDCGEDKPDDHAEYGLTVACHGFRERQTDYIKDVIANADEEYNAPGVRNRVILSHIPFCHVSHAPFDIEQEIYGEWLRLIRESIHPDVMLCGHKHSRTISPVGGRLDSLGQPCTVIIGGLYNGDNNSGCGVIFKENGGITAEYSDGIVNEIK